MEEKQNNNKYIEPLLNLLHQEKFTLSATNQQTLLALSKHNTKRLLAIVQNLIQYQLLSETAFAEALHRITIKLPIVTKSSLEKKSRDDVKKYKSEFLLDNHLHFFAEHNEQKNYDCGGFGIVKKGYINNQTTECSFAIKKLRQMYAHLAEPEAKREVKYNRLLNREAYYFTNHERYFIVSKWQQGKPLNTYTQNELLNSSVRTRFQWLASGLTDLNILHENYRIHSDIKPDNFILNDKIGSLRLIDFGTSHKKDTHQFFRLNRAYTDAVHGDFFSRDMYGMGLVSCFLFPDIYLLELNEDEESIKISQIKHELNAYEAALVKLVERMMDPNPKLRCTSLDALQFCKGIYDSDPLDEMKLKQIIQDTLQHPLLLVEDVLRGVTP
ncbi:MAG: protein kinase family protein [Gammaproteobacteria bacterium]|nr:protein kinase family protein [Gammaproteobacteria bacterium]